MQSAAVLARWPRFARISHWLGFALVALAYLLINLVDAFARGSSGRTVTLQAHFWVGLTVLVATVPRVWARTRYRVAALPGNVWLERVATATHLAIYAFLIVQPLLGLATLLASGKALLLPGGHALPTFGVPADRSFAHSLEDTHALIGDIFYGVLGLHIAAALWHHFVLRDATLRRMI